MFGEITMMLDATRWVRGRDSACMANCPTSGCVDAYYQEGTVPELGEIDTSG